MRSKRYTVEQIVAKLREAEKLHESLRGELGSGLEILRSALLQRTLLMPRGVGFGHR
jgi:hypothetical protein